MVLASFTAELGFKSQLCFRSQLPDVYLDKEPVRAEVLRSVTHVGDPNSVPCSSLQPALLWVLQTFGE